MKGLSAMLLIDVSQIPPEGLEIDERLVPGDVHLEGEKSFALQPGGTLRCHLERTEDDTVHVRGRLGARLGLDCGRCLEPFAWAVDQELDLFYLPHREDAEEEDEVELEDRDMVVAYYREGRLDLGETVREQLILSQPMRKVCREDCRGLCATCGVNRNLAGCDCTTREEVDPRLAPLARLFRKGSS
jgi:uncharacterized protein